MNVFAGVLLFISSIFIGYAVNNFYRTGLKNLTDFRDYLTFCESRAAFSRTSLREITAEYVEKNSNAVSKFALSVSAGEMIMSSEALSEGEMEKIRSFCIAIRNADSAAHKRLFVEYGNIICAAIKASEQNLQKKGGLIKKLSPIFGIGLFILVL